MSASLVKTFRDFGNRIVVFGNMIRFSHSVFALPFALAGVLFAAHARGRFPEPRIWFWVVVAMVCARSAAMAWNRLADMRIDAANPRTRDRALPRGTLTPATVWGFTILAVGGFEVACYQLNSLAFLLSPLALAIVFFYSLTKRFTWGTHLFLGLGLAVAPVGGWVAVTGSLGVIPFWFCLGVLTWVAGFDIFYALQDLDFDRSHGVHSVPARFGVGGALWAARFLHLTTVVVLTSLTWILDLSLWYLGGVAIIAGILVYEHRLVGPGDLSRLNKAFFDMNAVISVIYAASAAMGVLL